MKELTMDTVVDFKMKGSMERKALKDLYDEDIHGDHEDFFAFIQAWITAGRATIVDTRSREEKIADQIAEELMSVQRGKAIEQDRIERANYGSTNYGVYAKVGFPAKTLLDAQEMHQILMRNFNIKQNQLGVEMNGGNVIVTITDCPAKTYSSIERSFGLKRATEAVSGAVDKTAKGVINATDMTLNNIAVPVAKTAIGTTAKVAKSLFGFGAKLGGIAVGEITKATKQCVDEIKNDGYIAEAKGEVISGYHSIRRAVNSKAGSGFGGIIME